MEVPAYSRSPRACWGAMRPGAIRRTDRLERRERGERLVSGVVSDEPAGSIEWATQSGRRHLIAEVSSLLDENERLREEVARLRRQLRDQGLEPEV
ncbi:hypothetical protein [Streptomyces sp. SID13031]|uniref:hypothetical protein n=1 Tax=Streptomyces sp. SID13031 TaxID=2706046 RepID=UPI0013CC7F07|nr:hypothetical protein [Streptomyces sp. SID13031]NEA37257.1 hypothetical protein [Streptomyces sp. SID13031]